MKLASWDSLSPRHKRVAAWLAGVFLCYTAFGWFILPPLIRVVAVQQLSKTLGRAVTIQQVRLNPYALTATIDGLMIRDKDDQPWVSWDAVHANFQAASLFSRAWVFKEVTLSQPFVRVQMNQDYTLNHSDVVNTWFTSGASTPHDFRKSRAWRIERLRLVGARLSLTDLTPRLPFRRIVGPFDLTLAHFKTDPDSKNPYAFSGITDGGERFSWQGYFYLDPFRSGGELSLDGISLTNYAPLYQDWVKFDINEGVINLHTTYHYEKSAAHPLLTVTNTTLVLKSLKLAAKGTGQNVVEVSDLVMSGASGDAMAHTAQVAALKVAEGRFVLRRNRDASVNALELIQPAATAARLPGGLLWLVRSMTNLWAAMLSSTNRWSGAIHEFRLTNGALHWEDLANSPPTRLNLDEITVNAKNISNLGQTNLTAELALRWDSRGSIRADVQAALAPASAEVRLSMDQLNLRPLEAYLEPYLDLVMLSGQLGLKGTAQWHSTNAPASAIRIHGDVWLDDFSSADGLRKEEWLRWKALRVSGLEATLNPLVMAISEVKLQDALVRVIVGTNRTINLMTAWRRGDSNAPSQRPAHPDKSQAVKPPPAIANNSPAPARPLDPAASRAKITINAVVLTNATVQFIDRSLQPNVSLALADVGGVVSGLSTEEGNRASVHLRGTIDKTALAEMTGTLNPFSQHQPTDLRLALKNVDLVPASPYAGKYLGRQLNSGKLSANFGFHLAEGKLNSLNYLTLDGLTLGAEVASPEATWMPVSLAIAMLKDRSGKIELTVPVDGNLDDPTFHVGQAISSALVNEITQIAISPFSVLAAMFGGNGEDLGYLEFPAGAAQLSPANLKKLDALGKALHARPDLQLEITGSADAKLDHDRLGRGPLRRQVTLHDRATLAAARARNIKAYLVQTAKVEAGRVFLLEPTPGADANGGPVALRLR